MEHVHVIGTPIISERTSAQRAESNKYVFRVAYGANKHQIKEAVQQLFKVKVLKVNTSIMPGKKRRMGRFEGTRPDWKKAVVTVKQGQEIKLVEEKA